MTSTSVADADAANGGNASWPFLCGVIEGFYNRPWTKSQRMDLYSKMNRNERYRLKSKGEKLICPYNRSCLFGFGVVLYKTHKRIFP
jgi:hypothetical protein